MEDNACLNLGTGEYAYIEGYRLGADALVRQIEERPVDQDILVYPIVFGYRQYVELSLKALRRSGFKLYGWPQPRKLSHDLMNVWADCRKVIIATFPNAPINDINAAEKLVAEFDSIDPDSFAFRYATSKSGQPSLPTSVLRINLRHLRETMASLAMFIDSNAEAVAVALDAQP